MTACGIALIVLAKEPRPGKVKTRLCPPCNPHQAAALAEAALIDTLTAAAATPAARHVLVLDGNPGPWVPPEFTVIAQGAGTLAQRLATAFAAVGVPSLLIGMDTPQVTASLLGHALHDLSQPANDAVLGLADDGGYWAIGFTAPAVGAFDAVPMSTSETGRLQLERLDQLGLHVALLQPLRDVDNYQDAATVAHGAPDTCFAAAFRCLDRQLAPA
jgi:hypothetical protein